jgi:hypothetical protein
MCTHKLSMIGLGVHWHVHWPLGPPKAWVGVDTLIDLLTALASTAAD